MMKNKPTATIEMRLKICGEWEDWKPTTDGVMRRDLALRVAELRASQVLHPVKEYRVLDARGKQIWPVG